MTDWTRRERTVRTAEYVVPIREPWGADWNQLLQAIHAATREAQGKGLIPAGREPSDDFIRVHAQDDAIVIAFTVEESVDG